MTGLAAVPTDAGGQLSFEGMPLGGCRYSLQSASKLATERSLAYNQDVWGTWRGRVKGVGFVELAGELLRVHYVEVLEAEIEG